AALRRRHRRVLQVGGVVARHVEGHARVALVGDRPQGDGLVAGRGEARRVAGGDVVLAAAQLDGVRVRVQEEAEGAGGAGGVGVVGAVEGDRRRRRHRAAGVVGEGAGGGGVAGQDPVEGRLPAGEHGGVLAGRRDPTGGGREADRVGAGGEVEDRVVTGRIAGGGVPADRAARRQEGAERGAWA